MNIKKIIREAVEDFEWITNENNPWENIPQQDMDQLTEREKKLINNIFEEEDYSKFFIDNMKNSGIANHIIYNKGKDTKELVDEIITKLT